ncbi:hypothetical protein NQ176_g3325 [Zarea fungicola]|uniref:Uncharacterized protein n=1 Tax=Zarea fungicola TaxID=93591 RepID=A0ACC1NLN5_9HYPO|nr:hypothetical protein NQ176_g3325 [Lecanicillium fungicola]
MITVISTDGPLKVYAVFLAAMYSPYRPHLGFLQIALLLFGLALLGICVLMIWVTATAHRRSPVLMDLHGDAKFVGAPLLFPARLSHSRHLPATERYSYSYDYFMIGVPVGFRGRIGNLLSIDNAPARETCLEKCWFTIDPKLYLDRGSEERSLQKKLHIFLRSIGEDPAEFPHAYLLTVPSFLWFNKNVVSYWYLYSSTRHLTAMILEINNSYYEKKNIFCRLAGDSTTSSTLDQQAKKAMTKLKEDSHLRNLRFLPSAPGGSKRYKASWPKAIFASPFEKVTGNTSATFVDPLASNSASKDRLQSTISSQPVNPISASSWDIVKLLVCWTHVGAASEYRILKEATRLLRRGNLEYLEKPEVRRGSIPRRETEIERALERAFREYLRQVTSRTSFPLTLIYKPPQSLNFHPIRFHSPIPTSSLPMSTLIIQPLTPRFFSLITGYKDAQSGFNAMIAQRILKADSSCFLWVSDHACLMQPSSRKKSHDIEDPL